MQGRKYTVKGFEQYKVPKREKREEDEAVKAEYRHLRSAEKNELIEDMLDIILKHKKEIKKVPQCSAIDSATDWAAKRRLLAKEVDLDDDGTPEVVVFGADGKTPYVVNGYKLATSDYPIRREYWSSHRTQADRVKEPMHEWRSSAVYEYETDPTNVWKKDNIKLTKTGKNLAKFDGFRMPTAPKSVSSPYAIFSKLIAPMVKEMYQRQWIPEKLGIENADFGRGVYYPILFNKIISPISVYRWLYLRLVEQKHYFFMKSNAQGEYPYAQYKRELRKPSNKATFQEWFFNTILTGDDKGSFNRSYVSEAIIDMNMVKGVAETEGPTDKNDGLIQLLGGDATFGDTDTIAFKLQNGQTVTFPELIKDDELIAMFLSILNNKDDPQHRAARVALAVWKTNAAAWLKDEVLSTEALNEMMEDEEAYEAAMKSLGSTKGQSPNITSAEGVGIYAQAGGHGTSPVKQAPEAEEA